MSILGTGWRLPAAAALLALSAAGAHADSAKA